MQKQLTIIYVPGPTLNKNVNAELKMYKHFMHLWFLNFKHFMQLHEINTVSVGTPATVREGQRGVKCCRSLFQSPSQRMNERLLFEVSGTLAHPSTRALQSSRWRNLFLSWAGLVSILCRHVADWLFPNLWNQLLGQLIVEILSGKLSDRCNYKVSLTFCI